MTRPRLDALARRAAVAATTATLLLGTLSAARAATVPLADQPVFSTISVPGNLALALSVEFPTAISVAHTDTTYAPTKIYLGYFDPKKCYLYSHNLIESLRHFYPSGLAASQLCTGGNDAKWSGNFLNWATMQTVDPFRWALTGGYRSTDTATETILEKAHGSNQGSSSNFPDRTLGTSALVAGATPFGWNSMKMRVRTLGNKMRFTRNGNLDLVGLPYDPALTPDDSLLHELSVRVKVCDSSAAAGGLEDNCTLYPGGNYKPTGLMQKYASQIRYSAFGYLNDGNVQRDGGVLRAQQKFIGPMQPVPGSTAITNPAGEWDATTGVMVGNPDSTDAAATAAAWGITVSNSGVLNYLNKFGQVTPGATYKTYDPVGELYYAAIRYYRNLGDVPAWSSPGTASTATKTTWADGFPVISAWNDPILYSCQKNFVLGIGDVNTHADRNLPGASGSSEPSKPAQVSADTTIGTPLLSALGSTISFDSLAATNKVGALHGLGSIGATQNYGGCCSNNGALMAGIAYLANTADIRPDVAGVAKTKGRQSVQTYWLDILEYSTYKNDNQFYLAAKYGGFTVPDNFMPYDRSTDIDTSWWRTTADTVGSQARPDNYYTASRPDQMVSGLTKAFASIASKLTAFTTAFTTSVPQISTTGVAAYATQFDAKNWTGELTANSTSIDATTGEPTLTEAWRFSAKLDAQAAGTGWNTGRLIATWNPSSKVGVPFRGASIPGEQKATLDTTYTTGDDSDNYLNYLRGDRTHEKASTATGSTKAYRDRTTLLGDIVASRARPVPPPSFPYSAAANPGYAAFKTTYASRPTMVYTGTNGGMVHAVNGSLTGTGAGKEVFAYVPSALFSGPNGTPSVDGLAAVGKPDFVHKNLVDAPPAYGDVDFGKTAGGSGTDWRTILVGGLGKGGKSLYALDVTNPTALTTEAGVAGKVLWEFTHAKLGYSFGEPAIVKTRKYGWAVVVASGYNNSDGMGYFFLINPRTGALLEDPIPTGAGSDDTPAGLAHVQAWILDRTDGTAESVYAGDLLGNLWRLDLTKSSGAYDAPLHFAQLLDDLGNALPITSRPLIVTQPGTNKRFVTVGTGRLLASSDVASIQPQRFFAIIDGTGAAFSHSSTLPSGITFPIKRNKLKELTNLTEKVTFDLTSEIGWQVNLGNVAGGTGWRVITDPTSFFGVVSFAAMVPSTDNACEPSGTSRVYAIDLGTGQSKLQAGGVTVSYLSKLEGVVTDLRFYSVSGKPRLIAGTDTGKRGPMEGSFGPTGGVRRLNWREVPLTD